MLQFLTSLSFLSVRASSRTLPLQLSFFLINLPVNSSIFLTVFFLLLKVLTVYHDDDAAVGWSCFQMGLGRKTEDPEPGRCRRTDGKKWRCSKEAYPDSKYCERHMHRGKNRSRKPVEISVPTISTSVSAQNNSSLYPQPHLLHFASMDSSSQADNRNQRSDRFFFFLFFFIIIIIIISYMSTS